jgi:uncharacterized protein
LAGFRLCCFPSEPRGYAFDTVLGSPAARTALVGAWDTLFLTFTMALFNTVIGEELLFRGLLLPRMNGLSGKWDWAANGILSRLYHVHQPWAILGGIVSGALFFALPSRFPVAWFGIIMHSGQSIF